MPSPPMSTDASSVVLNARFLGQELTGVQRYGREMLARFGNRVEAIRPESDLSAIRGHLWEQLTLPRLCGGRLLWSPGNTGPLSVRHQVVTIHDVGTLDHPEWFARKFALWYRFLTPRLARKVRRVLTVSEFSRHRVIETCGVAPERVVAIPNGVDGRFQPVGAEILDLFRKKHQLDRPYFLYLGALEPRKNVATLLEAWKRPGLEECDLVLAGAAGRVFRDRGFTELPARTRLWGRVADGDLPALLSGALGFVYPSLYEGFGLPALEAMACGCPILISNTTSLPEVGGATFEPQSQTGTALYFTPTDADEMAGRMRQILALNEADRTGLIARAKHRADEFSWDRTAALTATVLEEAMAES